MMDKMLINRSAVHHTKSKGDLGVAKAYCDLVEKGFVVMFPATEHAPFDLVAYDGKRFVRIQVKYRQAVNSSVHIRMINWWADKNGSHGKQIDKTQIDVSACTVQTRTSAITSKLKKSTYVFRFESHVLKIINQRK